MNRLWRAIACGVLLNIVATCPPPAQAGLFEDAVRGLEYSGFQFYGRNNPLSDGAEFALNRNFQGETLDFGASELTLTGPIGFNFSTGGRDLPVLDFSLSTNDQAFQYVFETSSGAQDYLVEGNFLLDATGSINTFGFYDLRLQLSSRQDVFLDGRYVDGTEEQLDYDIGPIDIHGNIFADLLARAFDPLFTLLGIENVFDSFSGRSQREDLMQFLASDAQTTLNAEEDVAADEVARLLGLSDVFGKLGDEVPDLSFLDQALAKGQVAFAPVPEPGVMLFLLGPAVYVVGRRRRR